ncbi:roadblock/LC7 domain-containing protein [Rubellimicrobium roseum]|uniref:Roadblock/LC7 domain-containing protein n=1 Tax=Rubellimicrobium roseum TaxID=687525 RepID=A0A5C4NLL5_9RHOB|nr:roadblock/LC7 domain-containing protein [Rubellimicrobium roseum]TNC74880.1 roadblock/LC7 domain-containing protein [Rubellimicrobium roseum]
MRTDISGTSTIAGFIGAALVDGESGLLLASEGGGRMDLEAAAAVNTQVVKAERQAMEALGLDDSIDDILITLGKQLHLIRPLEQAPETFLYVALDKKGANLGMARLRVRQIEASLSL